MAAHEARASPPIARSMESVQVLFDGLEEGAWVGALLARVVVGTLFFLSGYGKLFRADRRESMRKTLREARIPFADPMATFVSLVEFIFGLLLVLGALTPLAALMLAGVMIVALVTVRARDIKATSPFGWLSEFLYLPEVLYLTLLVWLFFFGPGWLSADALLFGIAAPGR